MAWPAELHHDSDMKAGREEISPWQHLPSDIENQAYGFGLARYVR